MGKTSYDATSTDVVLSWVDGSEPRLGIPDRDLTQADIARMAYERKLAATANEGVDHDPREVDGAVADAIVAELVASGAWTKASHKPTDTAAEG